MQTFITAFFTSLITFLAIDSIWLLTMAKSFYGKHIGHLMSESPNFVSAGIFYIIYLIGLVVFVIMPAINGNFSLLKICLYGALFGLVTYATYDLTNQATLKNWPVIVTVVDLIWGSFLTSAVALITTSVIKYFS